MVHFGSFDLTLLEYPQNCPRIPFGTQNYTAKIFYIEIIVAIFTFGLSSVKTKKLLRTLRNFIL